MPRPRYQPPRRDAATDQALPLDTLCVVIPRQSSLSSGQHHLLSAEKNPEEMVAYARSLGFERVEVLGWDMGVGAYRTTIEDREALHHWLYQLLPSGQSKVVLVSQEDRLFRDETEIEHNRFIAQVRRYGGWVVCMVGGHTYNFAREFDREQFRLKCKFAKQYVEIQVVGRMNPANQRGAMRGRYAGGFLPWGYVVDYRDLRSPTYKHYVRYEPHATLVVDQVFHRFADAPHMTLVELARCWHREGLAWPFFRADVDPRTVRMFDAHCRPAPDRQGYRFGRRQARHILTDVVYLGWRFRAGELAREVDGSPKVCHEPLVEPDLFWWCFDRLLSERPEWAPPRLTIVAPRYQPRRSAHDSPDEVRFLAHGLVRCAAHERPMVLNRVDVGEGQTANLRCHAREGDELEAVDSCVCVRVPMVEEALCCGFLEQLRLDEQDLRELALLAERRDRGDGVEVARLEHEVAEHTAAYHAAAYHAAKQATLEATRRVPELAGEFIEDMRVAREAMSAAAGRLEEARREAKPSVRAWAAAQQAAGWAERMGATFLDWSRPAQARVINLALQDAVIGRVARIVLSIHMRWYGGGVSRREIVRPTGSRVPWTEEEDAALRAHFAALNPPELCALVPGRPWTAIRRRAYRLGLSRLASEPRDAAITLLEGVVATPHVANEMVHYGFPLSEESGGVTRVLAVIGSAGSAGHQ